MTTYYLILPLYDLRRDQNGSCKVSWRAVAASDVELECERGRVLERTSRFLQENGGIVVQNDLVPTNTPDYSPYILKIRQANPDFVYLNLAGVDQTTFLKQYKEYGLTYKLAGGVMDTIPFWAAGIDALSGNWQSLWYHGLTNKGAVAFTKAFTDKFGGPPDNQAWGDYMGMQIVAQAMTEAKSTAADKLIEVLEKGMKFDLLKNREGFFRDWDHQLLQEIARFGQLDARAVTSRIASAAPPCRYATTSFESAKIPFWMT